MVNVDIGNLSPTILNALAAQSIYLSTFPPSRQQTEWARVVGEFLKNACLTNDCSPFTTRVTYFLGQDFCFTLMFIGYGVQTATAQEFDTWWKNMHLPQIFKGSQADD